MILSKKSYEKNRLRRWQSGNWNRLRVWAAEERTDHAERDRQSKFQQRREVERLIADVETGDAHPRPTWRLFIRTLVKGTVAVGCPVPPQRDTPINPFQPCTLNPLKLATFYPYVSLFVECSEMAIYIPPPCIRGDVFYDFLESKRVARGRRN